MDQLKTIIAIISPMITVITLVFNIILKKNVQREYRYYEKILKPFMECYMQDNSFNAWKLCKNKLSYIDEDIPKYVLFLMKEKDKERLVKILFVDYFEIYPNDNKSVLNALSFVMKLFYDILIVLSIFLFTLGICTCFLAFIIIVESFFTPPLIIKNMIMLFVGIILIFISVFIMKTNTYHNDDRYTCKMKRIKKLIDQKVKMFDKNHFYYFY